jgi:predicted hydrocarbon binding protein
VATFQELKDKLELTLDSRLMLGSVEMILMPRWFFVGIMKRVVREAGKEAATRIYYGAGYEGAYNWGQVQIEQGLSGREVMEQYLGSMTHRGWGRFEIVDLDLERGRGLFRFHNSAVALEYGSREDEVCLWVPGALAGAFQVILDQKESGLKVQGREKGCLAQGEEYCEFVVEPIRPEIS